MKEEGKVSTTFRTFIPVLIVGRQAEALADVMRAELAALDEAARKQTRAASKEEIKGLRRGPMKGGVETAKDKSGTVMVTLKS